MDISKLPDSSFIKRLREKSESAWIELFETVGPKLSYIIRSKLRNYSKLLDVGHTVEDVIQTTFRKAYEKIHQCDLEKGALLPWLRTIATNSLNDELDKLKNISFSELPNDDYSKYILSDVEENMDSYDGLNGVDRLCSNVGIDPSILSTQDKIYVEFFFIFNFSTNIIAERTGRKVEAIRQAKKRLISKMRKLLEEKVG